MLRSRIFDHKYMNNILIGFKAEGGINVAENLVELLSNGIKDRKKGLLELLC